MPCAILCLSLSRCFSFSSSLSSNARKRGFLFPSIAFGYRGINHPFARRRCTLSALLLPFRVYMATRSRSRRTNSIFFGKNFAHSRTWKGGGEVTCLAAAVWLSRSKRSVLSAHAAVSSDICFLLPFPISHIKHGRDILVVSAGLSKIPCVRAAICLRRAYNMLVISRRVNIVTRGRFH